MKEALRIIADTEGGPTFFIHKYSTYTSLKRRIDISCAHPTLRTQIKQMLDLLEIPNRIDRTSLRIVGKGITRFHEKIGFGNNVKMTKGKYQDFDKNSVLEVMIITNELITQKKLFPSEISNLDEVLIQLVEIFDRTQSRKKVIEFLNNEGQSH
jgi:hypothetical protein